MRPTYTGATTAFANESGVLVACSTSYVDKLELSKLALHRLHACILTANTNLIISFHLAIDNRAASPVPSSASAPSPDGGWADDDMDNEGLSPAAPDWGGDSEGEDPLLDADEPEAGRHSEG